MALRSAPVCVCVCARVYVCVWGGGGGERQLSAIAAGACAQEAVTNCLRTAFSTCNAHREPDLSRSKRFGALLVVNLLFKMYFRWGAI